MRPPGALALEFRADSFDHPTGLVDAGTVISWIEKAGYAVAASWAGTVSYTHLTLPTNREV